MVVLCYKYTVDCSQVLESRSHIPNSKRHLLAQQSGVHHMRAW